MIRRKHLHRKPGMQDMEYQDELDSFRSPASHLGGFKPGFIQCGTQAQIKSDLGVALEPIHLTPYR